MNTPWSVITELENVAGRLDKEAIIRREAKLSNDELFAGIKYAIDSMITFGVKKVPTHGGPDGQGLPWAAFEELLVQLSTRKLTGNDAKTAIELALSASTTDQWNNWYRRILIKDLRCGISHPTVNKVVSKINNHYEIPVFAVQLAHDGANHQSKITGEKMVEVKLDGLRVVTVVYPSGEVTQYSRTGKELVNFTNIAEEFGKVAHHLTEPMVFDGEVVSKSFQTLMKQVFRKSEVDTSDASYWLFDMLPLKDFLNGKYDVAQRVRSDNLMSWINDLMVGSVMPSVKVVPYEMVNISSSEGYARFREINKEAIDNGFEGIMIKDPTAPYTCKRTTSWLKEKPFIMVSLKVTGIEEGTGKNEGSLGALICEGFDNGVYINSNVGSGFSDSLRTDIWGNRSSVMGQIVEVKADAVTQNEDGGYSLRFPRFECFRGFEKGEKL